MKTGFRLLSVSARAALVLGTIAVAAAPIAGTIAHAQTLLDPAEDTAASSASGALNLPANPTIFGKADPHLRRATAIVNGEIITGTDVDQRVALIVSANGGKVAPEELERLHLQVLRNLIDETLQIQEAKAANIEIDEDEVTQTFNRVAQQNFGQDPAALEKYLTGIGSSSTSLKRQIKGELAWQRLLRRNVQPFISVSDGEVREMMDRLKAAKGTEEYRIGEIYLSATQETKPQVLANAQKILEQLKGGGSFVAYARQYSEASTAAVGGDLGWIKLAQLPAELSGPAAQMNPGQLVGPIALRGGYSILYLIDKRQVLTADPRDALLSLKQISISFPKGTAEKDGAAKAAVIHYTRTQAATLVGRGIRVNCVAPGSIEFPGGLWEKRKTEAPAVYNAALAACPAGRMGHPEEVANLVVFLASPLASWITAQIISVNGGQGLPR